MPVDRVWRLTLVVMILTMLVVLGIIWGAGKIPDQARVLMRVMDAQLDVLHSAFCPSALICLVPMVTAIFPAGFPDHNKWFGHAQTAVGTTSSIPANTLVILFLGLLFSLIRKPIGRLPVVSQALPAWPCACCLGRDGEHLEKLTAERSTKRRLKKLSLTRRRMQRR